MRNIVHLLRFASTYVRLVRDPGRLDLVFALTDRLTDGDSPGLKQMLALPGVKAYLASGIEPLSVEMPVLRRMPAGSLGRAFADFLDQRGLDPTGLYYSAPAASSDAQRLKLHMERTHDLWHTVLGYDTDIASEIGLQAFTIAQLGSGLGYVICSGGLLNSLLFAPQDGPRRMEAIARGWRLGQSTRPLFGADWAAMMTWPLAQVREHFGVRAEDLEATALAA